MRVAGETVAGEANPRRLVANIDEVGESADAQAQRWKVGRVRAIERGRWSHALNCVVFVALLE